MNISEIKGKFEHDIKELDYQQTELYLNKMNVEELLQSQFDEELNQLAFGKENMLRLRKVNNDLFHLIHPNAKKKKTPS
ncbi:MAG: hypothetical protein IPO21_13710 [Bacteroidales bacterium]|nr:hypothetical protein [Bacteroidales bacterium]